MDNPSRQSRAWKMRGSTPTLIMKHHVPVIAALAGCLALVSCRTPGPAENRVPEQELMFLVMGCGPYTPSEMQWFEDSIALENYHAQGEFLVHLGDVQAHGSEATAAYHNRIAGAFKGSAVPAFIVPGDNEWTEQKDPRQAWRLWTRSFLKLHEHWNKDGRLAKLFSASGGVQHQDAREENFAFVRKGVLLIGINLPGGAPHDADEWARRLPANARWIEQNFERYRDQVRAAVIFAQTHPIGVFSEPFRAASKTFGKPVLYLHADFHQWMVSRPWAEQNILKVQTDQLGVRPPVLVTVREEGPELFRFDRQRQLLRGPYLALGTPRSMCVVWRTRGQTEPVVRYGRSPRRLDRATSADDILIRTKDDADPSRALHSSPNGVRQHEATIRGLKPATTYYYGVYDGDHLLAGADDAHRFTTSPETGANARLRFWVVGDSGTGGEAQAQVHQAMRTFTAGQRRPIDLLLHVGDMAYGKGKDHEFQNHFFKPYHRSLRNTVCWPAMGNHEGATSNGRTGIGPYYDCYVLPTRGEAGGTPSGSEAYYSFDHGNVHFIVLDSYDLDRSPDAAMARWLKTDLDRTRADWIFAYWHHPPYTKGSHDSDAEVELVEMRENIMPILEDGGVDMVFTGHSHIYERSMLIDGAYATPTVATGVVLDDGDGDPASDGPYRKSAGLRPHEGTVAIVTGHGGTGLGRTGTMPIMRRVVYPEHGSIIVDVHRDTATAVMLNSKGEQRDRFRIVKRGLRKPTRVVDPFQLPAPRAE